MSAAFRRLGARLLLLWLALLLAVAQIAPATAQDAAPAAPAAPAAGSDGVQWRICERPNICFADAAARQAWAAEHDCRFLEDVCEKAPASEDNQGAKEEDRGFWGDLWDGVKGALVYGYEFVKGLVAGLKDQIEGLIGLVTNAGELIDGLVQLGKAFYNDPRGTLTQLAELLGQDVVDTITRATQCGAYDLGKVIGENVSPVLIAKLSLKLTKFGGNLARAVRETKADLGCASFAADTLVQTPDGLVPISQIGVGHLVRSRSDQAFTDAPQRVVQVFHRSAPSHRILITESETLKVTDEHPLWVQGEGWTEASALARGSVIGTATGDTVVLHNLPVEAPLEVHNFGVDATPSYFVGSEGVWAHNAGPCPVPNAVYRAPPSPGGYRLGDSDGGPGAWSDTDGLGRRINRGDPNSPENRYQGEVSGAPHNVEYLVNGRAFDGYDSERGVLLDAKNYGPNNPLTKEGVPEVVKEGFKASVLKEARDQVTAADGTPIEWHVANKAEADALRDLFANPGPGQDPVDINVIWTPGIGG